MINVTPKPIVFKYFLWPCLCVCEKNDFNIQKYTKLKTAIAFLLFVSTSLEVYSQNNPYDSIWKSMEKIQ